ncbi:MAG: tRNA 5-methoxyuridine(34)/uridine 5-oxyacetic acid(34) synthase CmoB, partial [Pseudomonadales bacterium]|nr:tRNA 5-methoxyuridine(34)/uridine 5-oxyacetic acid(34) synthase CmoB [Pseudomonadales bacterium]
DQLNKSLMGLHPWRKGPFDFFSTSIDTEWRSDWKWQRIAPHISDLKNRSVLDVGCGSGYHCWRMRGEGAAFVLGIDPSPKNLFQFQAFKQYIPEEPVHLLPLRCEDMPDNMPVFDTVFSMGVLYHRRSPFDHMEELKNLLRPGGELVLETLVVDGEDNTVFVPGSRYAQMRNVWFLPSAETLKSWLKRLGFKNIRIIDITQTSIKEQRTTDWMTFHSLENFLDPDDHNKTIEGYPAPKRAFIIAEK